MSLIDLENVCNLTNYQAISWTFQNSQPRTQIWIIVILLVDNLEEMVCNLIRGLHGGEGVSFHFYCLYTFSPKCANAKNIYQMRQKIGQLHGKDILGFLAERFF